MTMSLDAIRSMPKAEVHVHLEGVFEVDELVRLAKLDRVPLPKPREELFAMASLQELLDLLDWIGELYSTHERLSRLAYRFAEQEAESGARYADLLVSPIHWKPWYGNLAGFLAAIDAGLTEAEQDGLPPTGLCVSLSRSMSASQAREIVDLILELSHPRIVALSIDGNEQLSGRVSERFREAFELAAAAGLSRAVHAGESSGPEGVWDAIDVLGADRVDHGVRSIEDPRLVQELASRKVPLDVCPGSNIVTRLYADRKSHPLDALRVAGVPVSINRDSGIMGTERLTLETEYQKSGQAYEWDDSVLTEIARTSITACFCDPHTRDEMLRELDDFERETAGVPPRSGPAS
jgi:adenosine deaminase